MTKCPECDQYVIWSEMPNQPWMSRNAPNNCPVCSSHDGAREVLNQAGVVQKVQERD